MRNFALSLLVTLAALAASFAWAGAHGLLICSLMIVMEISFSFDNAVVNAVVLRNMTTVWQKRFLTWGMLIAVFGMYYFFPIFIVSTAAGISLPEVMQLAFNAPEEYSRHLTEAHTQIASFGGMFLLMVFLKFILDESKRIHWLGMVEEKLSHFGKLDAVEVIIALGVLLVMQEFLPESERLPLMVSGVVGVVLYVTINSFIALFGLADMGSINSKHAGLIGFIYLNVLDASFSLDAVVGSFAISNDIVIIVLGLTAGAMFVRSLTVHLVRKGTLDAYIYLEHGAHYAIGALAMIMLTSILTPVSEIITGLIGVAFIALSFLSSVWHNRKIGT